MTIKSKFNGEKTIATIETLGYPVYIQTQSLAARNSQNHIPMEDRRAIESLSKELGRHNDLLLINNMRA